MAECIVRSRQKERLREQERAIHDSLSRVKHKLMVMSGKGGVGKSSIAVQMALALSKDHQVGILDLDLHAPSVPRMLGFNGPRFTVAQDRILPLKHPSGLEVVSIQALLAEQDSSVAWRGPIKATFIRRLLSDVLWGGLDYLIIDSPPGTGDEPLTIAKLIPDASTVIVTTPQEVSLSDVRKSIVFCKRVGLPILGVIENMSGFRCPHCNEVTDIFKSGGGREMAKAMGVLFLGSIPIEPALVQLTDAGCQDGSQLRETRWSASFRAVLAELLDGLKDQEEGGSS